MASNQKNVKQSILLVEDDKADILLAKKSKLKSFGPTAQFYVLNH